MSIAGIITMAFCWLFVIGFSAFLIIKTLRKPDSHADQQ